MRTGAGGVAGAAGAAGAGSATTALGGWASAPVEGGALGTGWPMLAPGDGVDGVAAAPLGLPADPLGGLTGASTEPGDDGSAPAPPPPPHAASTRHNEAAIAVKAIGGRAR
jgi:hypothetical protein